MNAGIRIHVAIVLAYFVAAAIVIGACRGITPGMLTTLGRILG